MAKVDPDAHRLHPKLRVYRNGDTGVNALRAELSACVASLAKPGKKAPPTRERVVRSRELVAVQAGIGTLSAQVRDLPQKRLKRRPKFDSRRKPKDAFVNVLVEVARPPGDARREAERTAAVAKRINDAVSRTSLHAIKGAVLVRRNFIAATVPVAFLRDLEADSDVAFVHPSDPLKLDIPVARRALGAPQPKALSKKRGAERGQGVLIGIIDVGGFDFAHPDFLDGNGDTRFIAIWDQGGDSRDPPAGFSYGSELTKDHLGAALKASRKPGGLPATVLERQSQQMVSSHGTHVASIAAGNSGVCPDAKIAGVVIDIPPPADDADARRFTFSDSSRITHAVEYLVNLADEKKMELSINISLGTNGGAHDGSSGVSRWIDNLLGTPGRAVTVAAGNAGQDQPTRDGDLGWMIGRIHTTGQIGARGLEVELEWVVIGDGIADVSENELELWYGPQDRISVAVRPPSGGPWITVGPQEFVENKRLASGTTVSVYNELYHPTNGSNYVGIYLSPNLERDNIRGIEAGVWRVRLRGEDIRDGRFNAWIERDDPYEVGREGDRFLFRFPSFFSAKSNVDSHSINSLACAHRVVAVANLDEQLQQINMSSSQGPTRDGRSKPDLAAPGTHIVAANGFALDGTRWVAMTGTSMAAPYVTGVIGVLLAMVPTLTAAQCLAILQRTARPLPGQSYAWRNDGGFGCIDAAAALAEAKRSQIRIDVTHS